VNKIVWKKKYVDLTHIKLKPKPGSMLVAHTCNPSYSGGSRFEASGANSSLDPISKIANTKKRAGGVAQGVGPEFKPQYHKKKKKERKKS
jgi:hypothetical protein